MKDKTYEIHDYPHSFNLNEAWVIYWKANHGALIRDSKLYLSLADAKERVGCTELAEAYAIARVTDTIFLMGQNL